MKRTLLLAIGLATSGYAAASSLFVSGFISGENRFVLTTFTGGTPGDNTQAGPMAAVLDGSVNFDAYCIDTSAAPLFGTGYDISLTPLPDAGLANSGRIAYLYEHFGPGVSNQDQGAGLQLAIWDVLVDGGDGLSAGNFRASSVTGTMNAAADYLSQSAGLTGSAMWLRGQQVTMHVQDLVGPVPEPGSLAALGILSLAVMRRKRR